MDRADEVIVVTAFGCAGVVLEEIGLAGVDTAFIVTSKMKPELDWELDFSIFAHQFNVRERYHGAKQFRSGRRGGFWGSIGWTLASPTVVKVRLLALAGIDGSPYPSKGSNISTQSSV